MNQWLSCKWALLDVRPRGLSVIPCNSKGLETPGLPARTKPGGSVSLQWLSEDHDAVLRITDDLLLADKLKHFPLCTCLEIMLSWAHLEERQIPSINSKGLFPHQRVGDTLKPFRKSHPCQQSGGLLTTSKHQDHAARSVEGTKLPCHLFNEQNPLAAARALRDQLLMSA